MAEVKPFTFKNTPKPDGQRSYQTNASPPEPVEEVPDGGQLVEGIEEFLKKYLVMPGLYLTLALWVLATHVFRQFDAFPYIAVVSAVKRCGKTRVIEVLQTVVHQPWGSTVPSVAALYRKLERGVTLLLDEIEFLKGKNQSEITQQIIAVLNAGHRKSGVVSRCDGPHHDVKDFNVFSPKLFGCIGRLPDTLMDRSIVVQMKRRTKAQPVKRFREALATKEGKMFRDKAALFVKAHEADIQETYQASLEKDLEFLSDRDADVWTPLFVMCQVAVPNRLEELKKRAKELSSIKAGADEEDSFPLTLLRDIREVWPKEKNLLDEKERPAEKCETSVLIDKLKALEESPWGDREKPLTPRGLARMLRPFEVEPRNIQVENRRPKGYVLVQLEDAFLRYLEEKSATCATDQ
jgi:hypothetical protein